MEKLNILLSSREKTGSNQAVGQIQECRQPEG